LDSLTMLTYPEYFPEVGLYFTLADWLGFHPATGDPSVFRGIVVLLIGSFPRAAVRDIGCSPAP
jgi:hypothetical protein